MKTFNYHSAKDVKEASKLSSSKSAYLAGGMTTIPSIKLGLASYKDIIDIKGIKSLSGIKVSGKSVKIGALKDIPLNKISKRDIEIWHARMEEVMRR